MPRSTGMKVLGVITVSVAAAYAQAPNVKPSGNMTHSGSPTYGVPPTFDCKARFAAWEYGKHLLPKRGDFRTLFEALQLHDCNLETPKEMDVFTPERFPTPFDAVFADATKGEDGNKGTEAAPVKTIAKAVALATGANATVVLRAGTYHTDTVQISTMHSGLTIQNYNGESVTVSGGVPLRIPKTTWVADPLMKGRYVTDLAGMGIKEITGMRRNGQRSIRAKYPNGNMELSGNWLTGAGAAMGGGDYFKGWVPLSNRTKWVPPFRHDDAVDAVANDADWPVEKKKNNFIDPECVLE